MFYVDTGEDLVINFPYGDTVSCNAVDAAFGEKYMNDDVKYRKMISSILRSLDPMPMIWNAKRRHMIGESSFKLSMTDLFLPDICPVTGNSWLSPEDLMNVWGTDKAPSIERIVPNGDYTRSNCTMVRKDWNTLRGYFKHNVLFDMADNKRVANQILTQQFNYWSGKAYVKFEYEDVHAWLDSLTDGLGFNEFQIRCHNYGEVIEYRSVNNCYMNPKWGF